MKMSIDILDSCSLNSQMPLFVEQHSEQWTKVVLRVQPLHLNYMLNIFDLI